MQEEIFEIGAEGMSVAELSQRLATPAHELLVRLFQRGIAAQVNQVCLQCQGLPSAGLHSAPFCWGYQQGCGSTITVVPVFFTGRIFTVGSTGCF